MVEDRVTTQMGSKVPADFIMIKGINILIDESELTGEPEPVEKL